MTIIANVLKGQLYPFDHCHMLEVHKKKTTLHNLYVVFEDNCFKNKQTNQPTIKKNKTKNQTQTKKQPMKTPKNTQTNQQKNIYFKIDILKVSACKSTVIPYSSVGANTRRHE